MTNLGRHVAGAAALAAIAVMCVTLASCSPGDDEIMPPEITYGEDVCIECNMIISDPKFASGYALETEPGAFESLAFDDVGSLLVHAAKHPDHNVVAWYVHDYGTMAWIDAEQAFFVRSEALHTPMAHGLAAHESREPADAMAGEMGGEVLTWQELRERYDAGALPFGTGMGVMGGHDD